MKSNKLLPPDGADGDNFGWDVAISQTTIAVGAPNSGNGKVYLFSAESWEYKSTLEAPEGSGSDEFGTCLAISDDGTVIVIGAPKGNIAFVMSVSGEFDSLSLRSYGGDDGFGSSVAIEGDTVVVGAPLDDEMGENAGAAYVFSAAGTYVGKMIPRFPENNANFGYIVCVRSTHIVVSSPFFNDKGSVYVYDLSGTYLGVSIADDSGSSGDRFGLSLAISSGKIIIGAPYNGSGGTNAGAAFFCSSDGITVNKKLAEDTSSGSMFGAGGVALSSEKIVVGAVTDGTNNTGAVYVYDGTTEAFIEKVVHPDNGANDEFGRSVAISETVFVVGAPFHSENGIASGSAYVFR